MSEALGSALSKGVTFAQLLPRLAGAAEAGRNLRVAPEERARPNLDHVVEGWVDGPPTSEVAFVLSGRDPAGDHKWRRFTLSRVGPWTYELGVFPTPFNNGQDPLAPGVPPSSSRRR
jgi:hypothetical protein